MRRLVPLLAAIALAAGCGGDDEPEQAAEGATGAAGAPSETTVGEFIAKLRPEKQRILEAQAEAIPACEGVKVNAGFVLLVSAAAIDADQNAPLAALVEEQC